MGPWRYPALQTTDDPVAIARAVMSAIGWVNGPVADMAETTLPTRSDMSVECAMIHITKKLWPWGNLMRRREFLTLLGGAAVAYPMAAQAQAGRLPTIGFMGDSASAFVHRTAAFVERLRELGWVEGRTVAIEYRWSEGRPERVADIAD